MNGLSALRSRGRALTGLLLLGAVTVAAASAAPAASATPLSPGASSSATALAAPGTPGNGQPPGGLTWSAVGATPKGPDGKYSFIYNNIKPGSTIKDWVELYNNGSQTAAFSVYADDASGTTLSGSLTYLEVGQKSKDIGTWVSFQPSNNSPAAPQGSFVMPGRHGIIEPFTIAVPLNATPGDHTGGLMVQVGVPTVNARGQKVIVYSRIGLPIELRVNGPYHTGMQVQSISTSFSVPVNPFGTGSTTISWSVANTGNVKITGAEALKVSGLLGSAQVTPPHLPTILPGDSVRVSETVPGLYPAGPYSATVTVNSAWPPSNPVLTNVALPTASGSASLFAVPWALIVLIVLLVGLGYGTFRFLRWRTRERAAELAAVAAAVRKDAERAAGKAAASASAAPAAKSTTTTTTTGDSPAGSQGEAE